MQSQHIGVGPHHRREVATLASHRRRAQGYPFISSGFSATFCPGYSQDTSYPFGGPNKGQAGSVGSVVNEKKTRRIRCPRASKSWQYSALLPQLQPVRKNRNQNSWLPTLNQSRLSRPTPANTSNSLRGQLRAASETQSIDLNQTIRSVETSHKILDASKFFTLNCSIRNNEGEEPCVFTSRVSPRYIWSRPVARLNQKSSHRNRPTISSGIASKFQAQRPVNPMMIPASCRMVPLHHPVSSARLPGAVAMTAAHPAAAHLGHQVVHNNTLPSGSSKSEGTPC